MRTPEEKFNSWVEWLYEKVDNGYIHKRMNKIHPKIYCMKDLIFIYKNI